jgi:membrane-associated phospholipid phosphatase
MKARRRIAAWSAVLLVPAMMWPAVSPTAALAEEADISPVQVVTEWNAAMIDALEVAHTPAPPAMRVGAIVQTSVFDAVDGITGQYTRFHVQTAAPHGALPAAAAAGAAHEALSALFPDRTATFDALLAVTLTRLADDGEQDPGAIRRGVAWGASVADAIVAWRAGDGFTAVLPPYLPTAAPGRWQPTPPLFGPPAFRQFAGMTPFAISSPSQFLPPAPPPLTSARYAQDFTEVKALGSATSSLRSPFDGQTALLWQSAPPVAIWDRVADTLITTRHLRLTDAARLLAQANIAMADAVIAIWNAKNYYDTWRPITAIQQAGTDGNPLTDPDPGWQPLIVTPAFQEYPSGHAGVSQAAAAVLAAQFGDHTAYTVTSANLPGVDRQLPSFTAGVAQVTDARVFGGIHFRFACETATAMGRGIATYVLDNQMQPAQRRFPNVPGVDPG